MKTSSVSPIDNMHLEATVQKSDSTTMSAQRQKTLMVFITLTQLVQMIPLGAGINSSLAIGEALGATNAESARCKSWLSYSITGGSRYSSSGKK